MSSCYKQIGDKEICECIYDKMDKYSTKEQIELATNPQYIDKYFEIINSCK